MVVDRIVARDVTDEDADESPEEPLNGYTIHRIRAVADHHQSGTLLEGATQPPILIITPLVTLTA